MADRYVLLGLARPRAAWFGEVGRWATAAVVPADFVRCVSAEELRQRVASGRRFSAALLDGGLDVVDRDLLHALRQAGIVPVVVADPARQLDWSRIGAAAVLPGHPTRAELLDVLATHAAMVDSLEPTPAVRDGGMHWDPPGRLVAVTGPAGVGASTTAMALAQGLAMQGPPEGGERVLLADLCLHAELAMLHDARDVAPGLPEVVQLHRGVDPGPEAIRPLAFEAVERGYDLLLGLRRAVDWSVHRPASVASAIAGLRRAWELVVADIDPTLEGEEETGSIDVQDRHAMARTAAAEADVVVVVGRSTVKWLHGLVRVLDDLGRLGVDPPRLLPVLVDAPRSPRLRAEVARALAELASSPVRRDLASPIFLGSRGLDAAIRDGAPMPSPMCTTLARAVRGALGRVVSVDATLGMRVDPVPVRINPGDLGLADEEVA